MDKQPGRPGRFTRLVAWWRRQSPKTKLLIAVGVVAFVIIGNLMEPETPRSVVSAGGAPAAAASPTATSDPAPEPESEPSESAPTQCNADGTPPPAKDAAGPMDHITLGKLTCRFEATGELDDAEVPVTIRNEGAKQATYTVTVQLLDASGGVVKNREASAYGLEAGAKEEATALLVSWGEEIETDGAGYWVRISNVQRVVEPEPEPLPTDDTSGSVGDGDVDVDMPDVHPGGFCGTPGAVGMSNGRVYTCRDGHWRR